MREFEARWRVSIIHRTHRGSTLTEDGIAVIAWAREVLHEADRMTAALVTLGGKAKGVKVAASLTVAEHLVATWLAELHTSHPALQPVLRVMNSENVCASVLSGAVDIGFIEAPKVPHGLRRAKVGQDRLVVVVEPTHRWARRTAPLKRHELLAARWVLREQGSGTRSTFEVGLGEDPLVALVASSTVALVGAAAAGVGPAVVSELAVRGDLEAGRLRAVPTELDLRRPLNAVWRDGERLSDGAALLLAVARQPNRSKGSA